MVSSESINYSKYSMINEPNTNISNELLVNEQNISNNEIMEMNSVSTESDKDDTKLLSTTEKNEINQQINKSQEIISNDLLYGNNIDYLEPKFLGKSRAFFYNVNGDPKITIGPDCK